MELEVFIKLLVLTVVLVEEVVEMVVQAVQEILHQQVHNKEITVEEVILQALVDKIGMVVVVVEVLLLLEQMELVMDLQDLKLQVQAETEQQLSYLAQCATAMDLFVPNFPEASQSRPDDQT